MSPATFMARTVGIRRFRMAIMLITLWTVIYIIRTMDTAMITGR